MFLVTINSRDVYTSLPFVNKSVEAIFIKQSLATSKEWESLSLSLCFPVTFWSTKRATTVELIFVPNRSPCLL